MMLKLEKWESLLGCMEKYKGRKPPCYTNDGIRTAPVEIKRSLFFVIFSNKIFLCSLGLPWSSCFHLLNTGILDIYNTPGWRCFFYYRKLLVMYLIRALSVFKH